MNPHVVVDIGNTRIKWGRCSADGVDDVARLGDDRDEWLEQRRRWFAEVRESQTWVLAGVQPQRAARLREWLTSLGDRVTMLDRATRLPIEVAVPAPDKVGIDRLLNAVAATGRKRDRCGAVLIDAGSALTIDWLDEDGVFRGGSISPGLDLMAKSLHAYTALLPEVSVALPVPELPATATIPAMQVGIFLAVSGGIREHVRIYARQARTTPDVFFTGGQAAILLEGMTRWGEFAEGISPVLWPEMTLTGILRCARAMP